MLFITILYIDIPNNESEYYQAYNMYAKFDS